MENFTLTRDYHLLCKKVDGFPDGIGEAFDLLYRELTDPGQRNYFGLSRMDDQGKIIYHVAAERLENDHLTDDNYESGILPASEYLVLSLKNWREHLQDITMMFGQLMKDPRTDKTFPCVEWYRNDDEMLCMMKKSNGA